MCSQTCPLRCLLYLRTVCGAIYISPAYSCIVLRCHPTNRFLCCTLSDLDFMGTVKLVNYIRSQVKAGNMSPDVSSKEVFEDDVYLKPVLEDDALLYSLDDVDSEGDAEAKPSETSGTAGAEHRILELQEELERLQDQFSQYKIAVQRSMEEQLSEEDEKLASAGPSAKTLKKIEDADSDYFSSYSFNGM